MTGLGDDVNFEVRKTRVDAEHVQEANGPETG